MSDFTHLVRSYLRAHPADRDLAKGAEIALRIHGNEYRYRAMLRNLPASADQIETELQKYIERKNAIPTKEEALQIRREAKAMLQKIRVQGKQVLPDSELSHSSHSSQNSQNSQKAFKAGKRFDHDSLPEHIQLIFDQNMSLRRRMSQYHLEIRNLLSSPKTCATQDLRTLTALLKQADEEYHRNWKKYDRYGKEGQNDIAGSDDAPTASDPDKPAAGS